MFSKSRRVSSKKRSCKNRCQKLLSIESLERREMFAANLGPEMASLLTTDLDASAPSAAVAYVAPEAAAKPINQLALSATFIGGVLSVTGTNGVDSIYIGAYEGTVYVRDVAKDLTLLTLPLDELKSVVVNANGGNDWVNVDHDSISVTATINGGSGNDTLLGGSGSDIIDGGSGADRIVGYGGNDSLTGSMGDDLLVGGDGNDAIYGNEGNDYVLGGSGDDLMIGESGDDQIFGEAGNDLIIGGDGQNLLDGGDGNDQIYGGDEADDIYGGAGDDAIFADAGDDSIRGEAGQDNIEAGDGADMVDGGEGKDVIRGGNGNDALSGGGGNDYLYGGAGLDWISGDGGNDALYGEAGKDWLQGGSGTDTLSGGSGSNQLYQDYAEGAQPTGQVASAAWYNNAGDLVDTLEDGANAVGGFLSEVAKWTLDTAIMVQGMYLNWVANLDDRVLRLGNDLATTLSNWPWEKEFWNGMGKVLLDMGEIYGLGEAWQLFFASILPWQRGLTDAEIEVARSVFGNSIDYYLVRVNEHSLMNMIGDAAVSQGSQAHVQGHIINTNEPLSRETLIHELVHIWQYEEDGLIYIPEAVNAQDGGAGYKYANSDAWSSKAAALEAANELSDFNREQQGDIVADYYVLRKIIVDNEAEGQIDSDNRTYLEVFIPFVAEVSTLSESQLRVPMPNAAGSDGDNTDRTIGVPLVPPQTGPVRKAAAVPLPTATSGQTTNVSSILNSLDSGPTAGTMPTTVSAPSVPVGTTAGSAVKQAKVSSLGGLSSSRPSVRAIDQAFGLLV